jgi:hypothetical protein
MYSKCKYIQVLRYLRAGRSVDRIPVGGQIFRTRPHRPWGPPSLLYGGYQVVPGVKRPECGIQIYLYSPSGPSVNKEYCNYNSTRLEANDRHRPWPVLSDCTGSESVPSATIRRGQNISHKERMARRTRVKPCKLSRLVFQPLQTRNKPPSC